MTVQLEAQAQPHLNVHNIYTSTSDDRCTRPRHTRDRRHTRPEIVDLQRPAVTATVDRWGPEVSDHPILKMVLLESCKYCFSIASVLLGVVVGDKGNIVWENVFYPASTTLSSLTYLRVDI